MNPVFFGKREYKELAAKPENNRTESDTGISLLPVECISLILAFTSPKDACRSAAVSPVFRTAADSDILWITFLPADYEYIISQASSSSSSSSSFLNSLSKKALYFYLCDYPLLIGSGNSSFMLEKECGKKCYMIGAKDLDIAWGNSPPYWTWKFVPESRFPQVAELDHVWWLHIQGKIETKKLSTKTNYAAYLVFKLAKDSTWINTGFRQRPVLFRVCFEGTEVEEWTSVMLDPAGRSADHPTVSKKRVDGWMEIEMAEIFNQFGDDGSIIFTLKQTDNHVIKCGLLVQGIEIRPK